MRKRTCSLTYVEWVTLHYHAIEPIIDPQIIADRNAEAAFREYLRALSA